MFTYNLRFPGQYYDSETGLHYNYFRTYDPSIGKYYESDPIGLVGGLNSYSYVSSRPALAIDPFGLAEVYVWDYGGSGGNWGHASMLLEDGTYISWWPETHIAGDSKLFRAWPYRDRTFEQDVEAEGKTPDHTIQIDGLDENAIKEWWEKLSRSNETWRTLHMNCSVQKDRHT